MYKEDTIYYPRDEMTIVLLPITSGCSYNKCALLAFFNSIPISESNNKAPIVITAIGLSVKDFN